MKAIFIQYRVQNNSQPLANFWKACMSTYITSSCNCSNVILSSWASHWLQCNIIMLIPQACVFYIEGRIFCWCHKFSIFAILFSRITGFQHIIISMLRIINCKFFKDLIFMDHTLSMKTCTAKYTSLENLYKYGIVSSYVLVMKQLRDGFAEERSSKRREATFYTHYTLVFLTLLHMILYNFIIVICIRRVSYTCGWPNTFLNGQILTEVFGHLSMYFFLILNCIICVNNTIEKFYRLRITKQIALFCTKEALIGEQNQRKFW